MQQMPTTQPFHSKVSERWYKGSPKQVKALEEDTDEVFPADIGAVALEDDQVVMLPTDLQPLAQFKAVPINVRRSQQGFSALYSLAYW